MACGLCHAKQSACRSYVDVAKWLLLCLCICICVCHVIFGPQLCMIAGADAAFHVLADAGKWQQAIHLATACLAINCGQSLQLLVQSHSVILVTVCPTLSHFDFMPTPARLLCKLQISAAPTQRHGCIAGCWIQAWQTVRCTPLQCLTFHTLPPSPCSPFQVHSMRLLLIS